jgi:hypothetical protein
MGLFDSLFGYKKPKVKCSQGDYCDLVRIEITDGKSSESYRWQCKKCKQQYFYSDSFLNGKKTIDN